jgi:hypothetical protein
MNHRFLFILIFLFPMTLFGQYKSDLGFQYEFGVRPTLTTQLRIPVANQLKLNVGGSWEMIRESSPWWRNFDNIIEQNDSVLTRRFFSVSDQEWQLHCGLTLQLPWKYFSLSGDIAIGLEREQSYHYSEYYFYDEGGSNYYVFDPERQLDRQVARQSLYCGTVGFRQGFHFTLPIGQRFSFGVSATQTIGFTWLFLIDTEEDPLGEFWAGWTGPNDVKIDFRATACLRYYFGKGREFKKIFRPRQKKLLPQ